MDKKEIFTNILAQIHAFDAKASILITAVGVIFASLSVFLLNPGLPVFQADVQSIIITYKVLFVLFFLLALVVMFCLVMVILPRRKRDDEHLYANYHRDIVKIKTEDLDCAIRTLDLKGQIKINASICTVKENWLRSGLIFLFPLVIVLIILVIFSVSV